MSPIIVSEIIGFSLIAIVVIALAVMSNRKEKQFKEFDDKENNSEDK